MKKVKKYEEQHTSIPVLHLGPSCLCPGHLRFSAFHPCPGLSAPSVSSLSRSRPLLSVHSAAHTRVRRVMDTLVRTLYGCLLVDDPMFSNEPDCEPDFPTPKGGVRIRPATLMPIPFSPPLPSIYQFHPLRPLRHPRT